VHKPGLRSSSQTIKKNSRESIETSSSTVTRQDERQLWWWSSNDDGGEEAADGDDAQANNDQGEEGEEEEEQESHSWWNWNGWGWGRNNTDDMFTGGQNRSVVIESLAEFSVKYVGCNRLASFVDEDENGNAALINQNFVTYRLCPSDSCNDEGWTGCKSVYGEYMMNLEDFLTVQQEYVDEEYEYFCKYCERCVYYQNYFGDCEQFEECEDYEESCSDEARKEMEEAEGYSLDDFFECKAIKINSGDDDEGAAENYGYDNGEEQTDEYEGYEFDDKLNVAFTDGVAYIGTHCNNGLVELGLFSDEYCTNYVGNQIDFFNATGYMQDAEAVQDVYVPDGCLACDGDNIMDSDFYFPENDQEAEEYEKAQQEDQEFVSEICYNMYMSSAKCHQNMADSDAEAFELSEAEDLNQEVTCNFIEDVVRGYVDDEGFVYSHQKSNNPITTFFESFGADPAGLDENVSGGQIAGLIVTGVAAASMAAVAYVLKQKVDDLSLTDGLITNEAAVST